MYFSATQLSNSVTRFIRKKFYKDISLRLLRKASIVNSLSNFPRKLPSEILFYDSIKAKSSIKHTSTCTLTKKMWKNSVREFCYRSISGFKLLRTRTDRRWLICLEAIILGWMHMVWSWIQGLKLPIWRSRLCSIPVEYTQRSLIQLMLSRSCLKSMAIL